MDNEFPHMQSPRPHQITGYGGDGGRRNSSIFFTGCWGLCGRRVEGGLLLLLVQVEFVLRGSTASLLEPSPFLKQNLLKDPSSALADWNLQDAVRWHTVGDDEGNHPTCHGEPGRHRQLHLGAGRGVGRDASRERELDGDVVRGDPRRPE